MVSNKVIVVPKWLTINCEGELIGKLNYFYSCKEKRKGNFYLSFSKVEKVDLLGLLLLYKFLEYSVVNNCFENPTLLDFDANKILKERIHFFGFKDLVNELKNNKDPEEEYQNLRVNVSSDFIIAPMALLRDKETSEYLNRTYAKQIEDYYTNKKVSSMIFSVFSEILLNFRAHAKIDQKSIIVAHGNSNFIEIVCADSGIGIVESIVRSYPRCHRKNAISKALQRGITSKMNTNHMGYGLWLVNEIVTNTKGRLMIQSENIAYENISGKTRNYSAPFWQGTIIYVKLYIADPITIDDIERDNRQLNEIKINFQ